MGFPQHLGPFLTVKLSVLRVSDLQADSHSLGFFFSFVVVVLFFIALLIATEIYSLPALSFVLFSLFLLNMNKIVLEPKCFANAIKEGKCTNINIK